MSNENEILTIAGERVEKRYECDYYEACFKCCFRNIVVGCNVQTLCHGRPCEKYSDHKNRRFAYFVRTEFDEMCPPQPIQGSIAPEPAVNKWAVTNAFLHCAQAGKIVNEMYGNKFNNPRNRDKYLAFLGQVNLDDRFGELAEILRRYGAMQEQKEQPEVDLEKLGEIARHLIAVKQHIEDMRLSEDEWSLIERIGYPERFNAKK